MHITIFFLYQKARFFKYQSSFEENLVELKLPKAVGLHSHTEKVRDV